MKRRQLLIGAVAPSLHFAVARAQESRKVIRWIVPYPAGGTVDVLGRKLAEMASARIGQQIIVDNKPGANGAIGLHDLVRSAPDGNTLGIVIPDTLSSIASLMKTPPFDIRNDLFPLAKFSIGRPIVIASAKSGIKSPADLVAAAKERPGRITYGSWGEGTRGHLAMACIEAQAKVSLLHVPYRGLQPIMTDLLGGNLHVAVGSWTTAKGFIDKDLVVPLGTMSPVRSQLFPHIKTLAEQGLTADYLKLPIWTGLVAPKGLPSDATRRWIQVLSDVTASPDYVAYMHTLGQEPHLLGPDGFENELQAELKMTDDLVKGLGIKAI